MLRSVDGRPHRACASDGRCRCRCRCGGRHDSPPSGHHRHGRDVMIMAAKKTSVRRTGAATSLPLQPAAARCCCPLLLPAAAARCCSPLLLLAASARCFCPLLLLAAAARCCCCPLPALPATPCLSCDSAAAAMQPYHVVDAFTAEPFGGNPAAVVLCAAFPADIRMQCLARYGASARRPRAASAHMRAPLWRGWGWGEGMSRNRGPMRAAP